MNDLDWTGLPGAELVQKGLADLARGVESVEALLVLIGRPRLNELGVTVPQRRPHPEHALYAALAQTEGAHAHSAYNALVRRLVSFERALSIRSRAS